MRRWERDHSNGWAWDFRVGRIAGSLTLIRHRYPKIFALNPGKKCSPTRWVVQTSCHYDVKERAA